MVEANSEPSVQSLPDSCRVTLIAGEICDATQRRQAARLVYASLPSYYDIFADAGASIETVIANCIGVPGTSLGKTVAAIDDELVVGVMASISVRQLQRAQYADLQRLLVHIDLKVTADVRKKLSAYTRDVSDLDEDGLYLSRIAVDQKYQGTGISDMLMRCFEEERREFSLCCLHVHYSNYRAIAFYRRHGYRLTVEDKSFRIMTKRFDASSVTKDVV